MAIEHQLARLTAQSMAPQREAIPSTLPPRLTATDIAIAAGTISKRTSYNAIMAKYCQDRVCETQVRDQMERIGWHLWFERRRASKLGIDTNRRVSDLAVFGFLNPAQSIALTEEGHARAAQVGDKTWRHHLRPHYSDLLKHLYMLESEGIGDIKRYLRGGEP